MKTFLITSIFLVSIAACGTKNKVAVGGNVKVNAPTEYEVKHKFSYDVDAFEDICRDKWQGVDDEKIEPCIKEKEELMEKMFNIIAGKSSKDKEKDKEND